MAEKMADRIPQVGILPYDILISIADAAAAKEVLLARSRFPKQLEHYETLTFFGRNIIASEGEEWKKYRRIVAPAFSDRNSKLVWTETVDIMNDLFKNVWAKQPVIELEHALDITLPIALFVIGAAGFGRRISWNEDHVVPSGHQLTFKQALHEVTTGVLVKLITPVWAKTFSARARQVDHAFDELDKYMTEMIHARRSAEKRDERYDLFTSLLDANDQDQTEGTLTIRELMGNVFIFLVAGHETTAHTLCFTFAMLALYPEEQEMLYQHIKSVLGDEERIPVTGIPKWSPEATVLNSQGGIPIPQGAQVLINVVALHHNPRYWRDPEQFKPSRFMEENWPRDAFLPFSLGPRACLGRKFFETEGIAILTMMVSKYKIELKPSPDDEKLSFEEKKAKLLQTFLGITLTPVKVPLIFKRRK
ncbi:hypothetical protein VNI00_012566 [Paramarasmius palmivorus]|uniref:Cytochrome P450 n=1 Tax=Paramarasmius palmivorus TaxID=297713 RepID=A0AAW0C5V2_9AGAR